MTTFLLIVFLWIFSVCLHEYAHAIVAYRGGDKSVKEKGYLSLNPMNYLDPMTSILLPTIVLVLGGIGLPGAAVYIDHSRLRSRHWESMVSLAGPAMNLLILLLTSLLIAALHLRGTTLGTALAFFGFLQASAVVLNMLPIPGFDGFGALAPHLPYETRAKAQELAPMMMIGFLAMIFMVPGVSYGISWLSFSIAELFGISQYDAINGYQAFRFWKQ
jgi:Zn-dependent protease